MAQQARGTMSQSAPAENSVLGAPTSTMIARNAKVSAQTCTLGTSTHNDPNAAQHICRKHVFQLPWDHSSRPILGWLSCYLNS